MASLSCTRPCTIVLEPSKFKNQVPMVLSSCRMKLPSSIREGKGSITDCWSEWFHHESQWISSAVSYWPYSISFATAQKHTTRCLLRTDMFTCDGLFQIDNCAPQQSTILLYILDVRSHYSARSWLRRSKVVQYVLYVPYRMTRTYFTTVQDTMQRMCVLYSTYSYTS